MADEKKKPKIDLKARLGKTQTGMGSSVPVPVPGTPSSQPGASAPPSSDGVPAPAVPAPTPSVRPSTPGVPTPIAAPAISPGIPLPPFAQPRPSQREPAAKPTAAQQTIKVEVGEEIHEERKKASKRTALVATLAAVVGLAAGTGVGRLWEGGVRDGKAIASAKPLEAEVKTANEAIEKLGEKLKAIGEALGAKQYPADLGNELGALNIPFDASNLEKPGAANLKAIRALMKYAAAVQAVNDEKEELRKLIGGRKDKVEKTWADAKEPVIFLSVLFRPEGGKGMVAELVTNKDPFKLGGDFPKEYTVTKGEMQQGALKAVEKKAKRWEKGDLTGSDPIAIPVTPVMISELSGKLADQSLGDIVRKVFTLSGLIFGANKGSPQETSGLLKDGQDLEHELHKIAVSVK